MTKQQPRNKKNEQLVTASRAMFRNGIELDQKEAGQTLLQAIYQMKSRVGKASGYEEVKFLLNPKPRKALIQIINEDPDFWDTWIDLQERFKVSGYDEKYKPHVYRIDSAGHYEIGNIQALSKEMHRLKHVKQVAIMVVENGNLSFKTIESLTAAQKELNVSSAKLNRMKSHPYNLAFKNEAGELIDTGKQIFAMPSYTVTRAEFLQMEIERLEQDKAELEAKGGNVEFINEKIAFLQSQIDDPTLMKAERDKQDKESYHDTLKAIDRINARNELSEAETSLLAALYRTKSINEMLGFDKI